MDIIIKIAVLVVSIIIHELAHGYTALALGDKTAAYEGRLTLNPIKHLDPIGSLIVPFFTSLFGVTFGWAKPVPYNPYNLKNPRLGEALIAAAGPATNIAIALLFGFLVRMNATAEFLPPHFNALAGLVVIVNIVLAVFNLIPLPPLDGSKILFSLFPFDTAGIRAVMERYWLIFIFFFIFFVWELFQPLILKLFMLFTGIPLSV